MFKNINLKIAILLGICKAASFASKTEWLYGTNPAFEFFYLPKGDVDSFGVLSEFSVLPFDGTSYFEQNIQNSCTFEPKKEIKLGSKHTTGIEPLSLKVEGTNCVRAVTFYRKNG